MLSTLKVAIRPSESRNAQTGLSSKPEKQPETQTAMAESLNFHQNKSLNKKILKALQRALLKNRSSAFTYIRAC
jgi:hypothetical protein